jgi:uncharacterized membrane protein YphA (DoxX/SURF4 family)
MYWYYKQTAESNSYKIMATITTDYFHDTPATVGKTERVVSILRWTFGLVPIVAGADKFMHLLTNWNKYLAPVVTDIIPLTPSTFMSIVGIIEIIAGILVLIKPRLGSLIVGLWLLGIAVNLILTGQYFDIAVRDTVMAITAFCLYTLLGPDRTNSQK